MFSWSQQAWSPGDDTSYLCARKDNITQKRCPRGTRIQIVPSGLLVYKAPAQRLLSGHSPVSRKAPGWVRGQGGSEKRAEGWGQNARIQRPRETLSWESKELGDRLLICKGHFVSVTLSPGRQKDRSEGRERSESVRLHASATSLYPWHESWVTAGSESQPISSGRMTGHPTRYTSECKDANPGGFCRSTSGMLRVVTWGKKTHILLCMLH